MHTQALPIVKLQPSAVYQSVASVKITLLANEHDGSIVIDVDPGDLRREEVLAKALAALAQEIVEMVLPFPV